MPRVLRVGKNRKVETLRWPKAGAWPTELDGLDVRVALIQVLIPLGLQTVADVLETEVAALAGPRYAREDGAPHRVRWGRQRGAVYLADQKVPIQVPRVRDRQGRKCRCRPMSGSKSRGRRMTGCCGGSCTG